MALSPSRGGRDGLLPIDPSRVAVIAITRYAVAAAARVLETLPGASLFIPDKLASIAPEGATLYSGPSAAQVGALFRFDAVVWIVSIGAVVRLIAPYLKDKTRDPGMVVLDEALRYAVPILSGHAGGGNALATHLATTLGAQAVLTTASDVRETLAVDMLGRDLGWTIEAPKANVTRACAAVVNDDPVALVQEVGSGTWWTRPGSVPANVIRLDRLEDVEAERFVAVLWISARNLPPGSSGALTSRLVTYRLPEVALGIGCDRDTPQETLARAVEEALDAAGSDISRVTAVGSIDLKADEPGMCALGRNHGWVIAHFTAQQLAAVRVPNPSEVVRRHTGTPSVAEAAALLVAGGAGPEQLLVEKHRVRGTDGRHATVSVARISP